MITPDTIRAMTPEERTRHFETMAETYYGTSRNAELVARDFDVDRGTVFGWRRKNNTPFAVLYTLDAWLNSPRFAQTIMQDWHSIAPELSDCAHSLSRVAGKLASIGRRMPTLPTQSLEGKSEPALPPDEPAFSDEPQD